MSCLLLLVPGGLGLLLRVYIVSFVSVVASVLSFLADYVFCGDAERAISQLGCDIHRLDRYFAFFAICSVSWTVGQSTLGWGTAATLVTPLPVFFMYSRSSSTYEQWRFRHTLWHIVLVVELCYVCVLLHHAIE